MKQKIRVRDYKMGDGTLIQTADDFKNSATRDLAQLSDYNIDAAWINTFETARDAFSDKPTDVELMGLMMYATQQKNEARLLLLEEIRQVVGRARLVFSENDGRYRAFGTEDLSNQTDNDLVRTGRRVVRMGTNFLGDLAAKGLTQAILDNLLVLTNDFDVKIDVQGDKVKERDIAVDERIKLGNELYALLVELGDVGKLYWSSKNEAYYNDYVIYKSPGQAPPQFETEGEVLPGQIVSASVTGVSENTVFQLQNTGAALLEFYFALSPVEPSGTVLFVVPPNNELTVSAQDLGYNVEQGYTYLNVKNSEMVPSGYKILWE